MKKIAKSFTLIALVISVLFSLCSAHSVPSRKKLNESGKAGKNITYKFNKKTGELTFKGKGAMYNYLKTDRCDTTELKFGYSPFGDNKKIKKVKFSDDITSIGAYAFESLNVGSIKLPKNLKTIGELAFNNCDKLKEIVIPDSTKLIKESAFSYCDSLKTVKIGDNVKVIEKEAFLGSFKIENITLGKRVEKILDSAFVETNITKIDIPASLKTIGKEFLANSRKLETINVDSKNTKFTAIDGILYNKNLSSIIKYPSSKTGEIFELPKTVTVIKAKAFNYNGNLVQVILPETVEKIEESAFYEIVKLEKINIPEKIEVIENYTFYNCIGLKTIEFSNNLKLINNYAFSNCINLKSVNLSSSIKSIKDGAFYNCQKLNKITIGKGAIEIGSYALGNTKWMKSKSTGLVYLGNNLLVYKGNLKKTGVKIKDGTLTIAGQAFSFKKNLKTISIPNSVEYIGENAFYNCEKMKSVKIPSNIKKIDNQAFAGCFQLLKISAPKKYFDIGISAFSESLWDEDNYKLNKVLYSTGWDLTIKEIESGVIGVSRNAYNFKYYNKIVLPSTVKYIAPLSFSGTQNLKTISIPIGVKRIEEKTFAHGLKLKYIELPSSVEFIANNAFEGTNGVVIKGVKDSYAHKFAVQNKIKFKETKFIQKLKVSGIKDKIYSKKGFVQNIKIKDGKKTLKLGKDFTVYYVKNKNVGKHYAIIEGKGDYSGVVYKKFNVKKI